VNIAIDSAYTNIYLHNSTINEGWKMLNPSSGRGSGPTVPTRIWQGRPVAMDDGRNPRPAQKITQVLREPDAHYSLNGLVSPGSPFRL
jgi:hypothetical protein